MNQGLASQTAAADFAFEQYFHGHVRGYGILHDRGGGSRRQFVVDITGVQEGDVLRLFEVFDFDDGERLNREWAVRRTGEGRFQAWASDVIGAAQGEGFGQSARWRYLLRVPVGGREWAIAMDDWMYAMPDGVVLSRVGMTKWGVNVASMTVTYRRIG